MNPATELAPQLKQLRLAGILGSLAAPMATLGVRSRLALESLKTKKYYTIRLYGRQKKLLRH